jgi:hypothetical protein
VYSGPQVRLRSVVTVPHLRQINSVQVVPQVEKSGKSSIFEADSQCRLCTKLA